MTFTHTFGEACRNGKAEHDGGDGVKQQENEDNWAFRGVHNGSFSSVNLDENG